MKLALKLATASALALLTCGVYAHISMGEEKIVVIKEIQGPSTSLCRLLLEKAAVANLTASQPTKLDVIILKDKTGQFSFGDLKLGKPGSKSSFAASYKDGGIISEATVHLLLQSSSSAEIALGECVAQAELSNKKL